MLYYVCWIFLPVLVLEVLLLITLQVPSTPEIIAQILNCCLDSSSAASSTAATTTLSRHVCHLYIHVIWIGVLLLFLISGLTLLFDRTHASHAA